MFGSSISALIYQLKPEQQEELVTLLKIFQREGVNQEEIIYEEKDRLENIISDIENTISFSKSRKKQEDAAGKGESTIPRSNWGVHETHCCETHGCKYGDPDCPVAIGLTTGVKCESCNDNL